MNSADSESWNLNRICPTPQPVGSRLKCSDLGLQQQFVPTCHGQPAYVCDPTFRVWPRLLGTNRYLPT